MQHDMIGSPTSTDVPLEYITVEAYEWPKQPRVQRARMDEEERKRRHREGQRQFMQRKRARILQLRRELDIVETQFNYLWAIHEEKLLREDKARLEQVRDEQNSDNVGGLFFSVPSTTTDSVREEALDAILLEVVNSL